MTTVFSTRLPLDSSDGIKPMAEAFSAECRRQGIWATASAEPDDANNITFTLKIDEALRCKPGPRAKTTSLTDARMRALHESGMKPEAIAKVAGISRATFYRRMSAMKEEVRQFDY